MYFCREIERQNICSSKPIPREEKGKRVMIAQQLSKMQSRDTPIKIENEITTYRPLFDYEIHVDNCIQEDYEDE